MSAGSDGMRTLRIRVGGVERFLQKEVAKAVFRSKTKDISGVLGDFNEKSAAQRKSRFLTN
jgi:hypothetical protein